MNVHHAARKDGKFLVSRNINGRVFRSVMTREQLQVLLDTPEYVVSAAERRAKASPFGPQY